MAKKQAYFCDVCGAERKEANHWFIGGVTKGWAVFHEWDYSDGVERDLTGRRHLCGQVCAHKLLDEFLSK